MTEQSQQYLVKKTQVSRSFNSAAQSYQLVNQLQDTVAERLLERLDYIKMKPGFVLDLGSGPGTSANKLASYYRRAQITETDISYAMLQQASRQAPRFFSRRRRLCSDAEMLAIKSSCFDLVYSNLMLQWCSNVDSAIAEALRVLRPNGLFIFSTFGPDTLNELRHSWQQVDDKVHVNAFIDMHDIGDALIRLGFENPVMETEKIVLNYSNARDLMQELKMIGAHNVNEGRRKTLTGKSRLQQMLSNYENKRVKQQLPATYEVIYGHAWCPAMVKSRQIDGQNHVFPLSALKPLKDKAE